MRITKNFAREEFDSADGTPYPAEWIKSRLKTFCKLFLEPIRALTGKPMRIHSGFRTPKHNHRIGGGSCSQHLTGRGCDFSLKGMTIPDLYKAIEKLIKDGIIPECGLGLYPSHIHIDNRGSRARWRVTK